MVWSRTWLCSLSSFDDKCLLIHECEISPHTVPFSLISNQNAGMSCFVSQHFSKCERVGFYYGTLLHIDMRSFSDENGYGGSIMAVSGLNFCRTAFKLCKTLRSFDGQLYSCTQFSLVQRSSMSYGVRIVIVVLRGNVLKKAMMWQGNGPQISNFAQTLPTEQSCEASLHL